MRNVRVQTFHKNCLRIRGTIMKWYQKIVAFICAIVFSPLIILGLLVVLVVLLIDLPKEKKQYKKSEYYKEFNLPYKTHRIYTPEYRFYNSMRERTLPIEYVRQESNGLEYFIYENVFYLFPDFEQITFNMETNTWEVDYDGDWEPFNSAYERLVSNFEEAMPNTEIKILVERKMIPILDLKEMEIPDCIFLTWSYESAFENEASISKIKIPTDIKELFDMMSRIPDICGNFYVTKNGNIEWDLYDSCKVEIYMDSEECCLDIVGLMHWHPTIFEIYDEILELGKRDNVLVIRTFLTGASLLYQGNQKECPYDKESKAVLGEIHYLETK